MKKLSFLLIISIGLFSCEADSVNDVTFSQDNNPGGDIDTDVTQEKIVDEYNETDGGL